MTPSTPTATQLLAVGQLTPNSDLVVPEFWLSHVVPLSVVVTMARRRQQQRMWWP
jgi:hypothetical protein